MFTVCAFIDIEHALSILPLNYISNNNKINKLYLYSVFQNRVTKCFTRSKQDKMNGL